MSEKVKCCKQVRDEGRWPSFHRCRHDMVVERDGKPYCKQHDPVAVKARNDVRSVKWDAKWALARAESAYRDAAVALAEFVEDRDWEGSSHRAALNALLAQCDSTRAALARQKGEKP